VADLIAKSPCDGLLPLAIGAASLSEVEAGAITSISPFEDGAEPLAEVLKSAHGLSIPAPNRATGKDGARAIWFSRSHVLLVGPKPDPVLAQYAAVTDQSDAWTAVRLEGDAAVDVLARLVPVDLRQATFKRGYTVRTMIQHMNGSITRVGDRAFQIMVFRSMAATLVHDLKTAMEGVAARR